MRCLRLNKSGVLLSLLCVKIFLSAQVFAEGEDDALRLRQNLSIDAIRAHQRALQDIAESSGGNRMAGTSGYQHSVSYVAAQLQSAGYQVRLQDFNLMIADDRSAPVLRQTGPQEHGFVAGLDFSSMSFSGSVQASAQIEAIDLKIPSLSPHDSSSGCEVHDFSTFTRGNIALIQRGGCAFSLKAELAIAAGASGVIIFNDGSPGRQELLNSRLDSSTANFPVLGASFATGNLLRGAVLNGPTNIFAQIKIDVVNTSRPVQNVIAETAGGDASRVLTVGCHLDSVRAGPGMNDNGSGSATVLAIAESYAALGLTPRNKVRFIWFGAEEFGLIGSTFYVGSLSAQEKSRIMAMLNFDMLGSPNYARFVYDGDHSGVLGEKPYSGPQGSGLIEKIFLDFYFAQGLATHPSSFDGRSDYGPFLEAGIPAGGLFSGAEGIKSQRLAQIYGGVAGAPFDACYHRSCDNYQNTEGLALKSLSELSQGAAHAVASLANTEQNIRPPQSMPTVQPQPGWEYRGPLLVR